MSKVNSDEVIQNIKKVVDKYQEIMLYLMQGKGTFVPISLVDKDKNRTVLTNTFEQFYASPEKFMKLNVEYMEKFKDLVSISVAKFTGQEVNPLYIPASRDRRFKDPAWQENIFFDFVKQFYLMSAEWVEKNVEQFELEPDLKKYLEFTSKQFVDAVAPSNFVFWNPQVLRASLDSGWQNVVKGLDNFLEDIKKGDVLNIQTTDKSAFKLGENIAATPGKIIFQNDLMQLICYEPKEKTYKTPLLIIPPWINKYYILDLSSHNSLVKFLVDNNFQVFMVSWINPSAKLASKDFEDYLKEGVLDACEYIVNLGYEQINAAGYCIGGTLLATGAAYMKTCKNNYLNSISLLTTLLDFAKPGEVGIFINESSITAIEAEMEAKGYFDGKYLANSFSMLRANDLVWSFFINNYLLGKSPMPFDLLYWNADPTNLPAKMNSYYLRNMYLNNLLKVEGGINMLGKPIDLSLIDCPAFFLAANDDHIAPWKAVYEGISLLKGKKMFCLTASGHVAGVVNPPKNSKYSYQISDDISSKPEEWLNNNEEHKGSWWLPWKDWLVNNSQDLCDPINYNNIDFIEIAPGSYVKK